MRVVGAFVSLLSLSSSSSSSSSLSLSPFPFPFLGYGNADVACMSDGRVDEKNKDRRKMGLGSEGGFYQVLRVKAYVHRTAWIIIFVYTYSSWKLRRRSVLPDSSVPTLYGCSQTSSYLLPPFSPTKSGFIKGPNRAVSPSSSSSSS